MRPLAQHHRTARAVALLGEAVATAADRPDGPAEVLRCLREAIPFDAATLARLREGELQLLASAGHADGIGAALRSPEYRAEHAALGMLAPGRPLRFADLPCGGSTTFTARELAWPEGLRGGLGMALYAVDGREVGFVSVNTEARDGITDLHRDLVGLSAGLLAHAVDVPGLVARRHGGRALIAGDGAVVPIPDAAPCPTSGSSTWRGRWWRAAGPTRRSCARRHVAVAGCASGSRRSSWPVRSTPPSCTSTRSPRPMG
ncbi:hypothetical protein DSM104299_04966 [Baekduia alba]|uniref:hypothetical protein n=1 Tax=Baekduia alba TaxID=2997333 RepID=UPI002340C4CD|nr:hypothetical protein [Baekduia alba]WCB96210.1 hypothetical protein DSM104299_04966 [Baekduia alba]